MTQQMIDETSNRYGMLVVISYAGKIYGTMAAWLCRCDCGSEKVLAGKFLRNGESVSCGCKRASPWYTKETFHKFYEADENGCWRWKGKKDRGGYGRLTKSRGRRGTSEAMAAHRLSYELHVGPIDEGMCVCHSCDVRDCVNTAHLWLGTQQENMQDMHKKGRGPKGYKRGAKSAAKSAAIDATQEGEG